MLDEAQLENLLATNFVNKIDENLTIISEVRLPEKPVWNGQDQLVFLYLNIYYDGEKVTTMCFNLINYEYEDILDAAKNIKNNNALLKEVDDYLCGDIE